MKTDGKIVAITIWDDKTTDIARDIEEITQMGIAPKCVPLFHSQDAEQIIDGLKDADFLIAGSERLDKTTLPHLKNLKLIVRFGVGYDNVDLSCAKDCGIAVTNLPGANAFAVAEHVLGMMIASTHRMLQNTERMKKNVMTGCVTDSLSGVIGILGFGAIGKRLAELLRPFGAAVKAYDPYVSAEEMRRFGAEKAELGEIIRTSDIISLHIPVTEKTHHIVDAEFISEMKDGAYIFNTARGALMDERAVADALNSGKLAGAGADVFETEPPDINSPLFSAKNIILTPHSAAATKACFHAVMTSAAHQIANYCRGEKLANELTEKD